AAITETASALSALQTRVEGIPQSLAAKALDGLQKPLDALEAKTRLDLVGVQEETAVLQSALSTAVSAFNDARDALAERMTCLETSTEAEREGQAKTLDDIGTRLSGVEERLLTIQTDHIQAMQKVSAEAREATLSLEDALRQTITDSIKGVEQTQVESERRQVEAIERVGERVTDAKVRDALTVHMAQYERDTQEAKASVQTVSDERERETAEVRASLTQLTEAHTRDTEHMEGRISTLLTHVDSAVKGVEERVTQSIQQTLERHQRGVQDTLSEVTAEVASLRTMVEGEREERIRVVTGLEAKLAEVEGRVTTAVCSVEDSLAHTREDVKASVSESVSGMEARAEAQATSLSDRMAASETSSQTHMDALTQSLSGRGYIYRMTSVETEARARAEGVDREQGARYQTMTTLLREHQTKAQALSDRVDRERGERQREREAMSERLAATEHVLSTRGDAYIAGVVS
ncbi:hypothetical protein KIPB_011003, partial [Kipferlia bialata]